MLARALISRVKARQKKPQLASDTARQQAGEIGGPLGRMMRPRMPQVREGDGPDRVGGVRKMLQQLRSSRGKTLVG